MLKRAILSFRTKDLEAAGLISPRIFLHNAKLEILNTFSLDRGLTTMLLRVTRREGAPAVASLESVRRELLERYNLQSFEMLDEDKGGVEFTVLVGQRNSDSLQGMLRELDDRVFPVSPCILEEVTTLFSLCAPEEPLRRALDLLRRVGLQYSVKSITPYRLPAKSPLTSRQASAVDLALELGFFAVPRRTDLRTLSKILQISPVALSKLLRRAEERLLREALERRYTEGSGAPLRTGPPLARASR